MSEAAVPVATGHVGRRGRRGGLPALGLVGARGMRGARTGLACGAAPGDPEPRTRSGRLPASRAATWPPSASRALRIPAGPPAAALDPAVVQAARRDPVARGGRGAAPDQQAGGGDRGGPARDSHPRRHLLTNPTGRGTAHPSGPPPRPTNQHHEPEEGIAMADTHVTITGNGNDHR